MTANLDSMLSVVPALVSALLPFVADGAQPPARNPALVAIAEAAQNAPPEFRALALLRLAESGRISDATWKRELLEQAFMAAASARTANPVVEQSGSALRPALDRLSLQTRAVDAMRTIDGRKSRELFLEIAKPVPRKLECAATTFDDLGPWYASAAQLVGTFSPTERRKQDHLDFAVRIVSSITSVVEIAPAQVLLTVPGWRPDERDLLGAKFAGALEGVTSSPRAFALSETVARQAIDHLAASGYSAELVRAAWTRLVDRVRSVEPCPVAAQPAAAFGGSQMAAVPPPSPQSAQLASHWMKLMFGPKQQGLTDADKNTRHWRDELASYLGEIEALKADSPESEVDLYQVKTEALGGLLVAVPQGEDRDRIRTLYVRTLAASPLQQQNPTRWFATVRQLVDAYGPGVSVERSKLLDALESTGNPALLLYAKLERAIPSPPSIGPDAR